MHFSRVDKAILCGVTVAGIGVITTAALADELGLRKKKEEGNQVARLLETGLQVPSMPSSTKDFMHMWASGYESFKGPLAAIFEVAGQALVAPIAMVAFDAAYEKVVAYMGEESKITWNSTA